MADVLSYAKDEEKTERELYVDAINCNVAKITHQDVGQMDMYMGDMENDTRTHHIHIVKWNGTEWKNYIHFRDYLNDNENMALQYQKVKEELESKYADDRVAYTNGKQDMIDLILDNQ